MKKINYENIDIEDLKRLLNDYRLEVERAGIDKKVFCFIESEYSMYTQEFQKYYWDIIEKFGRAKFEVFRKLYFFRESNWPL